MTIRHTSTSRIAASLLAAFTLAVSAGALATPTSNASSGQTVEQQKLDRGNERMTYDNETESQSADRAAEARDDNYGRDENEIEPKAPNTDDASVPESEAGTQQGQDFEQ